METTTVEQPGTVALAPPSTVLNPETVKSTSGGGKTDVSDKGNSIQDVLDAELSRLKEEDAKAEAEAKEKGQKAADDAKAKADEAKAADKGKEPDKAEKPEAKEPKAEKARDETGKFAKTEKTEDQPEKADKGAPEKAAAERSAPEDNRQSEGRKYAEPPARFLPEARTKWANVPNEVKAEFHRVSQEMENEIAQSKDARDRYEPIRQFDDIARSNGRELKDSLAKVVQIEQQLARNPIAGLDAILREIGPRKQDGSPVTLMEVAQHIVQNPQAYQQASARPAQVPQQQDGPQIAAVLREVAELKSQLATASVQPMIEAFSASHPDYRSLEPQIAEILNSGVVDKLYGSGLSPEQKLTEAYRMAGGLPSSRSEPELVSDHSAAKPAPSDQAGTKSIRGAPDNGSDTVAEEPETDLREMLRKQYRRLTA
jgi:hypothetical protein